MAAIVRDILKYKGKINNEYKESKQEGIDRKGCQSGFERHIKTPQTRADPQYSDRRGQYGLLHQNPELRRNTMPVSG